MAQWAQLMGQEHGTFLLLQTHFFQHSTMMDVNHKTHMVSAGFRFGYSWVLTRAHVMDCSSVGQFVDHLPNHSSHKCEKKVCL